MLVSCTTLCMGRHNLAKVFEAFRELDLNRFELVIHDGSHHVSPEEVIQDPLKVAARLKSAHGLTPGAIFYREKRPDFTREKNELKSMAKLARLAQIPLITVLSRNCLTSFMEEVTRLRELVAIAGSEGIQLAVASHQGTWAGTLANLKELCEKVPGLQITLDPSHLGEVDFTGKEFEPLIKKVAHTHLRDSVKGGQPVQVKIGQGALEYAKLIQVLEKSGYSRLLSIDIHELPDSGFPTLPEVRKLKYLLESSI